MDINQIDECVYVPISLDEVEMSTFLKHAFEKEIYRIYLDFYRRTPSEFPWLGYFVVRDGDVVGVGGFKGNPVDHRVEIAYGTAPEFEGQGIASRTCRFLTDLAMRQDPTLRITARTLREENASTRILRRNGYHLTGEVEDAEDGLVWEWEYGDPRQSEEV